jgi:hypothetical protein
MDENRPVLLYGIINGVPEDAIKDVFGQRRIYVDFEDQRPEWAGQLAGTVVEIQTLYGEYGGYLGFATYESEGPRAKPSPKVVQEREANIAKMMAIIQELAAGGELTLMLQTTEFVPGQLLRQKIGLDQVNDDFLLRFPHNTIVSVENRTGT